MREAAAVTWAVDRADRHAQALHQQFANDVEYYLQQQPRQLPSRYLYDPLGSALFEAICELPWYVPTRAEAALLARHASEILEATPPYTELVELGSGNGEKLAALISEGRPGNQGLDVHLVDISLKALTLATRTLEMIAGARVHTHQAAYETGLAAFRAARRGSGRALALMLGSNIGNFDPPAREALLRQVRGALRAGDALLLGTDLVKPERDLLLAYDDPLGVTAAFNRNLLVRLNRELGGELDVDGFAHRAIWNAAHSRVEMHLVSLRRQRVRIREARLDFEMGEGESIWTESSYKFASVQVGTLLERCGFAVTAQWVDADDGFALTRAAAS